MLTDKKILNEVEQGNICISPFNKELLNPNSYDVTLNKTMVMYVPSYVNVSSFEGLSFKTMYNKILSLQKDIMFDCKQKPNIISFDIPDEGITLQPNVLYLYSTNEKIGSDKYASKIEGKSSLGRLGLFIHVTAGFIDVGFIGNITLEVKCIYPTKIYPNQKIGQVAFYELNGDIEELYRNKEGSKYKVQEKVTESQMYKNF